MKHRRKTQPHRGYDYPGGSMPPRMDFTPADLNLLLEEVAELKEGLKGQTRANFPDSLYIQNAASEIELIEGVIRDLRRGVPILAAADEDGWWFAYQRESSRSGRRRR